MVPELGWTAAFVATSVSLATPLLATALGEVVAERAGVLNIGLEGMMLAGAFAGFAAAHGTGSPWLGLVAGVAVGVAMALAFAVVTITLLGDQIVAGTALNILAVGATGVAYRSLYGVTGSALSAPTFEPLRVPLLGDLPFLGEAFFAHNVLVYATFALVVPTHWFLHRTRWGLALRAVGEHPRAADTVGVPVFRVRYAAVLLGGGLAGASGAYLSLAHANTFVEGMTAGRGFMALAIVIFGKWSPWGALGGALLFGAANALRFRFGALGLDVPYQVFLALPYAVVLAALALFVGRARAPAALTQPYARE
ncbi:MAG: ABC transporter permease [Myxococcales bacterium]|nr:ABC transporter permease [Myxococcales bacterium]